ncbi:MAG: tRNA pseudouridine(38-40) synthase TruA [Chlamydiae bacterium]|nr:tRNA pseudouridine(38-40) synthase TruA [Chlamydiota bacterium]
MRYNLCLHLSYDGTLYYGWQKTRHGPSIEETLEKALATILQHPIRLQAASRTDAGVHAEDQVVNAYTTQLPDLQRLPISLNQLLPKDIRVLSLSLAPEAFHPTLDCLAKEYHYRVTTAPYASPFSRHFSWHFPHVLDVELMKKGALLLTGRHDFQAFTNTRQPPHEDTVREIFSIYIEEKGDDLCIQMKGNHFLYKMARNLAGTLCYIGCQKIALEALPDILSSKQRIKAGMTAPAQGLVLKKLYYPSL